MILYLLIFLTLWFIINLCNSNSYLKCWIFLLFMIYFECFQLHVKSFTTFSMQFQLCSNFWKIQFNLFIFFSLLILITTSMLKWLKIFEINLRTRNLFFRPRLRLFFMRIMLFWFLTADFILKWTVLENFWMLHTNLTLF